MSTRALVDDERSRFRSEGYLVVANMIPVDAVAETRLIAADLLNRRVGRATGDFLDLVGDDADETRARLPQLLMPVKYAPILGESPLRSAAWSVARDLLGDDVEYQGEHIIAKPPQVGAQTPLHQDEAFWSGDIHYECISIWIPLQDVGESEGCLCFVPGSHLGGILMHCPAGGNPACNSFELVEHPAGLISAPMRVGELSVHHCRTIHGAGPNTGTDTRYAYIYGFGLPAKPAAAPRAFSWQSMQSTARQARAKAGQYKLTKMRPES
jgi:ectoine hydroxylase-related dioxygenase (phytanoyl-CoA dioxygenase family)